MPDGQPQNDKPPGQAGSKKPPRRKLRRWLLFFGVLGIIALLVNGPVARWGIHKYLGSTLEKIGLVGDFEIGGSIARGFILRKARLDGHKSIQKLYFSRAQISYGLIQLIREQTINVLALDDPDIIIDIAYQGAEKEIKSESDKEGSSPWSTLSKIQPHFKANPIRIRNAKFALVKGVEPFADVSLSELSHEPGSEELILKDFIGRRGDLETPEQTVTITWSPNEMQLDRWEVVPNLSVFNIAMDWEDEQLQNIRGQVAVGESHLSLIYASNGELRLNKESGPAIASKTVSDIFGVELPIGINLDAISAELRQMTGPIPNWHLDASAEFSQFTWKNLGVEKLTLVAQQRDGSMEIKAVATQPDASLSAGLNAQWTEPLVEKWWMHGDAEATVELANAGAWLKYLEDSLELDDYQIGGGNLNLKGQGSWAPEGLIALQLETEFGDLRWREQSVPNLQVNVSQKSTNVWDVTAKNTEQTLNINANLNLTAATYEGSAQAKETALAWVNPLIQLFVPELSLKNVLNFSWSGSGSWKEDDARHEGGLELEPLQAIYADVPLSTQSNVYYSWPGSVKVNKVAASYGDFSAEGSLDWEQERLSIPAISVNDTQGQLLSILGALPLSLNLTSAEDFLKQEGLIQLQVSVPPLALKRLISLAGLEESKELDGMQGSIESQLLLDGTFQNPVLRGNLGIAELRGLFKDSATPISGGIQLNTLDGQLMLDGKLQEGAANLIGFKGELPFKPVDLITKPDSYRDLPIKLVAKVENVKLQRLIAFVPDLEKDILQINGDIGLEFELGGSVKEPDWNAKTLLEMEGLRLENRGIPRIERLTLKAAFAEGKLTLESLDGRVGGGLIKASGTLGIDGLKGFDFKPELGTFDFKLSADHAPVHRDDQVLVRASADLNVKGDIDDATIAGQIDIVESLFFKDIELIPIGVPSSGVAKFEMPSVDAAAKSGALPIPKPFANWKLDMRVAMKDPFLVRGNLAKGHVTGSMVVGGTLSHPSLDGSLQLEQIAARLPFSELRINESRVSFTPNGGLNPQLDIRARSKISSYDVSVFVYGSVSNPKVIFSSNPPLPETEIMTLLATGTTTTGLEDTNVASAKAFQLLLAKVKQRSNRPGGNKLFGALLSVLDKVDLNFGDSGPFTNRRHNSATINFTERWNFTAIIDQESNTRGLVVFSIRIK